MKKNLLNLIALIICNGVLTAQIIKGKVLDTKTIPNFLIGNEKELLSISI